MTREPQFDQRSEAEVRPLDPYEAEKALNLVESADLAGVLSFRERVDSELVAHEFPFGGRAQRATGYSRLVRLRNEDYALVR